MKLIQESLNFERGQDPKTSLKIGFGKYSNEFGDGVSKALIKLKPYLDKYGFKMDEEDLEPPIKLIFSNDNGDDIRIAQRNTLGNGIHGVRVEFSLRNGLLFFDPTTKFENEQVEKMNPEEIFQKHFGNPIKEGLNFERGNFPKKALKIGMTELLHDMEEKFKKKFPGVISRYSYFHPDKKTGDGDAFFAHLLTHSVFWNRTVREFFEKEPYFEIISYEPLDVNSSGASDDAILKIKFNPNKLKESVNFERGIDPKSSMRIGNAAILPQMITSDDLEGVIYLDQWDEMVDPDRDADQIKEDDKRYAYLKRIEKFIEGKVTFGEYFDWKEDQQMEEYIRKYARGRYVYTYTPGMDGAGVAFSKIELPNAEEIKI